jgi:hypothetical protein
VEPVAPVAPVVPVGPVTPVPPVEPWATGDHWFGLVFGVFPMLLFTNDT